MKTDLEKLIDTAKLLCESLEQAAREEIDMCQELQDEFEVLSWQTFKIMEEIKLIKKFKEIQEEAG
jgi:hypothetical protein